MNASCALQHFCDLHGPQILLCTEAKTFLRTIDDYDNDNLKTFYSQYVKSDNAQDKVECKSCTLSSDALLISTIDFCNRLLFISSASTPNQELFKNTRNACVRSLNVERAMENDHSVLFGDDESGYCLSLTFSCKDFHARGSQRLYALCYLCDDKYHLLSLMTVINRCLRDIVHWIQSDANDIYEQEGHIRVNTNFNGTTSKATYVLRPPPRSPSQRMLSSVVGDSNLIFRIHAMFVWLLRITHSAIQETMYDALPTEEQTTERERKDMYDYDLRKSRTRTVMEISTNGTGPMSTSIRNTFSPYESIHVDDEELDDEDDFDSLEYQFSSYGYPALKLFREFVFKLNNLEHLEYLLYHWVIGDPLVLKYTNRIEDKDLIRALVSVLRLFLPDGCCHIMEKTDENSIYSANLILLNTETSPTVIHEFEKNLDPSTTVLRVIFDGIDHHLHLVKLERLHLMKAESHIPTYVKKIVDIITDQTLDDQAFEAIILHEKMKYLNKAKVYFQVGRCLNIGNRTLSETQQMNLMHVTQPTDLFLIRFWQKGLSQNYKNQIRLLKQNYNQEREKLLQMN